MDTGIAEGDESEDIYDLADRAIELNEDVTLDDQTRRHNKHFIHQALTAENNGQMELFIAHLESGFQSLSKVSYLYSMVQKQGVSNPEKLITVPVTTIFGNLRDILMDSSIPLDYPDFDEPGVLVAAALSGEINEQLLSYIIFERIPRTPERFLEILAEAQTVNPNFSSGIL